MYENIHLYLIFLPVAFALITKAIRRCVIVEYFSMAASFVLLAISYMFLTGVGTLASKTLKSPIFGDGLFYADHLSAFMAFLISLIFFITSIYSGDYLESELKRRVISERKVSDYYFRGFLFVSAMMLVVFINNIGLMWASVEATTLVSALLVGFYNTRESAEAAWKYLIICTVAIALSLFGIVLLNYAIISSKVPGLSLDYSLLSTAGKFADLSIMKFSFVFVLIGYGTKAGLAPMHTWLPDAYSQSPAPVSAMLSGVLSACSTYSLIRFEHIARLSTGQNFASDYFIVFGLLSLFVAFPFIVLQNDIKRLVAYSSIEHTGIIYLALGFGGPFGLIAVFYHTFYHAVLKSLMFLTAGSIISVYKTNEITKIKGLFEHHKFLAVAVFIGGLGLCGMPPFGIFFSELMVLFVGLTAKKYLAAALYLICLSLIFIGFLNHLSKMTFGHYAKCHAEEAFECENCNRATAGCRALDVNVGFKMKLAIAILFVISAVSGIYMISALKEAMAQAVALLMTPGL
ncbi:MAG: Hydrogenase-4 component B [bacterium ADurb.Bin243]|nr:MAG: Hydrogenase-4 component B [bacterium ADurb.Bin243]